MLLIVKLDAMFFAPFDGDLLHWAIADEISDINFGQIS